MTCKRCGAALKPGENWYPSDARSRSRICKACRAQQYKDNPKVPEIQRRWYSANRDAVLAQQREYAQSNREARLAYHRSWYAANTDKALNDWHLREARKRANGPVDKIDRRAVWGRDEGRCRVKLRCDGAFVPFEEMHLDHVIPVSRGGTHTWNNVQTSCEPCNRSKGTRFMEVAA